MITTPFKRAAAGAALLATAACGPLETGNSAPAANQEVDNRPAAIDLMPEPRFDAAAGESNMLRKLDRGIECLGVTAVANSETVAVNVDLSTNDAKGVQVKLTLAAGRTVQGYMDGTNGTINTDLGGGYGRVNATAMIPFGTKGAFNSIECPAAGIDGIDLVQ